MIVKLSSNERKILFILILGLPESASPLGWRLVNVVEQSLPPSSGCEAGNGECSLCFVLSGRHSLVPALTGPESRPAPPHSGFLSVSSGVCGTLAS